MKIVGLYNWHDGGYAVLDNGILKEHIEFERYTRLKESPGDSLQYLKEKYLHNNNLSIDDISAFVSPCPVNNLTKSQNESYDTFNFIPQEKISFYSHHLCHASHAFYSSNLKESLVLTIDSAGMESDGRAVSTCGYYGYDKKIEKICDVENNVFSLGALWGRCTRFIFKMSTGFPRGHQAGSVMAMAALGNANRFYDEFYKMATTDFQKVKFTPPGYVRGKYVPPDQDVKHPYLDFYRKLGEHQTEGEQNLFDMAAALQKVTEDILFQFINQALDLIKDTKNIEVKSLCLAGGVSLNSVFTGKIIDKMKGRIENVFVPPVPYDGGLSIGACQYHWHHVLDKERNYDNSFFVTPYLGEQYTTEHVEKAIKNNSEKIIIKKNVDIDECANLLVDNKIISLFQGRSESGRRALGNRSIIANPINSKMKSMINDKVKHRQWYRPFAPSVLEDCGAEWFKDYFVSPYMGFVFPIKKEKIGKAPAIEHFDGTARIQTVNRDQNKNYYDLINKFYEKTGVPIVLNTSFNDREPIVETPEHAINCFLGTDIDYLYFLESKILLSKKNKV
jgi:carbamoyltransferase